MGDHASSSATAIQQKYAEERAKRIRPEGNAQFISTHDGKFARFAADPWAGELEETKKRHSVHPDLTDGTHSKILIVGAGYGGLYFATRLLDAGFKVEDLLLVDSAGGFGGTWYWNRYPGLMCDVESYIYMPLLEETGYMPKHKYASGNELREHAERIAEKWSLHQSAAFKTVVRGMKWDDAKRFWTASAEQEQDGGTTKSVKITADFVVLATGLLNFPKMPGIPGIEKFRGHSFHTSRWDYAYTGGSTEEPRLTKLKDKKVGIIGTGATAIQAIPHLAKWAKELYVFQRTPSAVDRRDNRETDADWWAREVTSRGKGWQWERMANYNAFVSNVTPPPAVNMVGDGWTKMPSYSVLVGGPNNMRPDFVTLAHELDLPRQDKIRARVDEIVKNPATAQSLKAWYAGWCKRPTFHDEYLETFNKPHVTLVDTDGRGISALTENGLLVNNTEYDVDLIVFSTGFELSSRQSPASRACFPVVGRGGLDMEHKWLVKGIATLHGCVSRDFPNMFYPGPNQGGAGPNQSYTLDMFSQHIAYIIAESSKRAAQTGSGKVTVEPTAEAEQAWAMEIAGRARGMAAVSGCTPSYLNGEGAIAKPDATMEEMIKMAQMAPWGEGIGSFTALIEEWRKKGDMAGLEIKG